MADKRRSVMARNDSGNQVDTSQVILGDCLEVMRDIADNAVDMVFADLPYGTTACSWDTIIPFEPLWEQLLRVTKDSGALVFTGSQPFTSALVMSNPKLFRYEWIWQKTRPTGFFTAKIMPMKIHENVLVFYRKQPTYKPKKVKADENKIDRRKTLNPTYNPYLGVKKERVKDSGMRYPVTVQTFSSVSQKGQHPTQKPIGLLNYLIETYSNEGDTILDPTMGSGTTCVSAKQLNRKYIGIEINPDYVKIAQDRLKQEVLL